VNESPSHAMPNFTQTDSLNSRNNQLKKILFYRNYQRFQGGHLKVWHYFQHAVTSETHQPTIHFSANSLFDATNPWSSCREDLMAREWQPEQADVLFLAGLDWQVAPPSITVPVINLIQSVSHADDDNPRKTYLTRPAFRICISEEVRQAVVATGLVNGPIVTMPNCIDLPALSSHEVTKTITILIAGMKNPGFALEIAKRLREDGHKLKLLLSLIPRHDFLDQLKVAQLVILLPMEREGFFLPALEAMAMGCLVVCPDCIGNRSFCHDGINSFRPQYQLDAIVQTAKLAIKLDKEKIQEITSNARKTVEIHALLKERLKFQDILKNLNKYT
jgi:hypothetical protein